MSYFIGFRYRLRGQKLARRFVSTRWQSASAGITPRPPPSNGPDHPHDGEGEASWSDWEVFSNALFAHEQMVLADQDIDFGESSDYFGRWH